ncbi:MULTISPECIES: hypothetical protein [unclassified Streptomyces]|uniref:hypothetical protein n=1 Tax=Streptomyces sp. NPDC056835 TaxID=3345956 RepID=UPI0036AD1AF7
MDTEEANAREERKFGKERRKEHEARRRGLRFSLHIILTEDRSRLPGAEVEAFLEALRGQEGASE